MLAVTTPSAEALRVFETLPDCYLVLSPEQVVLTASDAYLLAARATRAALVGQPVATVFPAAVAAPITYPVADLLKSLREVVRTKRPHQMPAISYAAGDYAPLGSTERSWQASNTPVLDEVGEVAYVLHKVTDITVQQRADLVLDNIDQVYFELDEAFRFAYVDQRALAAWGKAPAALLGHSIWQVFDTLVGTAVQQVLRTVAATRTQLMQEVYWPVTGRWVFLTATPSAAGLLVLYFDVTERRHAQERLHAREATFEVLINNMPDIVTRWDKDLKLVYANADFEKKTGLPNHALYGKGIYEMGHLKEIAAPWKDKMKLVFRHGRTQEYHIAYPTSHGTAYYHSLLVPEFAPDGTVQTVLVIARDIASVKQLEEKQLTLKLTQQKQLLNMVLEAQEGERRRIAESLHNGLGQLLYAAKLNLDNLEVDGALATSQTVEAKQKANQLIVEAIKQTRSISHELLPTILEDFGLTFALRDVCKQLTSSKLQITCQLIGSLDKLEQYQEIALYRIVQELLINVVKHAAATQASLRVRRKNDMLTLLVQDNGQGFQTQPPHTQGIGLKTIRDRIHLLNGTTDIASTPKKGTKVTITLPIDSRP